MVPIFLTIYVLILSVIVADVLFFLLRAFWQEWRQVRIEGKSIV
ncbi:putative transporter small subunit [Pseudorhodobacter aquimaris]